VRYPFGHGLSYTAFGTGDLRVVPVGRDAATVAVTATNTGRRAGKHVVQVYVATAAGPVRRPARELRAFTKVALQPGESRTVELALDRRAFAYWDVREGGWVVAPGEYAVQVCADADTVLAERTVVLAGDDLLPALTPSSSVGEWFGHPLAGPALRRHGSALPGDLAPEQAAAMLQLVASMPMRRFVADIARDLPAAELDRLAAEVAAARAAQTAAGRGTAAPATTSRSTG
jgi:beta-glucosidase